MSFQEKSAIATLVALAIVFGGYFTIYVVVAPAPPAMVILFIIAVIALVTLLAGSHAVMAILDLRGAQDEPDERDNLIELKAIRTASTVLGMGALASASLWLVEATTLQMAHAMLLSLVVAEIVQRSIQIAHYRRGV